MLDGHCMKRRGLLLMAPSNCLWCSLRLKWFVWDWQTYIRNLNYSNGYTLHHLYNYSKLIFFSLQLHSTTGKCVLYATHLLPNHDKVVVTFSLKSKQKLSLLSPSKLSPIPISPTGATSPSPINGMIMLPQVKG